MKNAYEVQLTVSLNGKNELSETFLVFRKEIQPPQEVINELLRRAKNDKERQRIQRSAEEAQPVEVAFKLEDGRITDMKSCVLFAYLPTTIKTDLYFIIQARYQTTLARDNIQKDNPWNRWLVRETADFLPEILEQLKLGGFLEPAFFNVIPLKTDPVPEAFTPISEVLRKAMQERPFVPTQDGGYAKAGNVFYPDSEALRELIDSSWLQRDSSWLHPKIRNTDEFRQCFKVVQEAGVKTVGVSRVLGWLEERDPGWFEAKSNEWLRSLYAYLKEQKSELERIKKLPLVRLENGQHVCAGNELVFFPPDTDEDRKEIGPLFKELPIFQSILLEGEEGEERNDIEAFLKDLGVGALRPEKMIDKWIIPQYSKSDKPSKKENLSHVHYLFKIWDKLSEYDHRNLKKGISETPILRAYNGPQREVFDFVKPCDAYLPKTYTGDDDLETYFSVCNGNIWFVDEMYLDNNSNSKDWSRFMKVIGAIDTPRVVKKNISANCGNHQEFDKRNIKRASSNHEQTIEDFCLQGLSKTLCEINRHGKGNLSQALWGILVKTVPSTKSERDTFFQGTHRWFHYSNQSKPFEATFYRQLKSTAWIPDKQGNLHKPPECFVPTSENRKVLGDSVSYLPDSFNISTEVAKWLAEKLGVHLKADTESVLKHLQALSGTDVSVEKIEPLYSFLYDTLPRKRVESVISSYMPDSVPPWRQKFNEESLIFIPEPKPRWWLTDEVFWEDESAVFGNDRGYLRAHYGEYLEYLKSFFTSSLGVPKHADTLDYIRGIKDIASAERIDEAARKRVEVLYGHLWQSLLEDDAWLEDEKWEQVREESCWLGKKGNDWGFFSPQELVWKDDDYRSELFKNEIPFWMFGNDLLELAKELGVKGCYQDSDVKFNYCGNREEDTDWSAKVRNLDQDIYDFLNSPLLCGEYDGEKSIEILAGLSVCRVEKLDVRFRWKRVSVLDPNPRQSFLDPTNQKGTLWLALEANQNQYAWLIGDALQDYFGNVKELSGFVEDLLTKDRENVLTRWKQKGLQTNIEVLSPEEDSKEGEEDLEAPVDDKLPANEFDSTNACAAVGESDVGIPTDDEDNDSIADGVNGSEVHFSNDEGDDSTVDESEVETLIDNQVPEIGKADIDSPSDKPETHADLPSHIKSINVSDTETPTTTESATTQTTDTGSEHGTPTVNERSEIGNGSPNSTTEGSGPRTYNPSGTSGTSRSGGHSLSTSSNRGSGGGGHGGSGGGGESDEHRELKERLAANTSELDAELKLVEVEHTFGSGDRVDILLKNGSENPVTVEVETGFSSGAGRYVGVWQAVKYKHLAAVEYGLPCEQVRSILAAPEIPDEVKTKCKKLGIEPCEVHHQGKNANE